MHVSYYHYNSARPDVNAVIHEMLAEYFAVEKRLSRYDIAHLVNTPLLLSYPGVTLVVWDEETPVGMVMVEVMEPRSTRPYGHEITRLYVKQEYRQQGIGKALMIEALAYIRSTLGSDHAFLLVGEENADAVSLYKKMKFTSHAQAQENGTEGVLYLHLGLPSLDAWDRGSRRERTLSAKMRVLSDQRRGLRPPPGAMEHLGIS